MVRGVWDKGVTCGGSQRAGLDNGMSMDIRGMDRAQAQGTNKDALVHHAHGLESCAHSICGHASG